MAGNVPAALESLSVKRVLPFFLLFMQLFFLQCALCSFMSPSSLPWTYPPFLPSLSSSSLVSFLQCALHSILASLPSLDEYLRPSMQLSYLPSFPKPFLSCVLPSMRPSSFYHCLPSFPFFFTANVNKRDSGNNMAAAVGRLLRTLCVIVLNIAFQQPCVQQRDSSHVTVCAFIQPEWQAHHWQMALWGSQKNWRGGGGREGRGARDKTNGLCPSREAQASRRMEQIVRGKVKTK